MNGRNKTKIALLVLSGLLVILIAVAAFITVSKTMKEKNYSEALNSAEKLLASNNYEQAIVEFKKAISVDPKDDEGYLALAEVYIEQEEPSKARAILRKGVTETASFKIKRMLESLNMQDLMLQVSDNEKDEKNKPVDLASASKNIAWNTSFIQKISSYNFAQYKAEFGSVESVQTDEDGFMKVVHSGLDGVCYYRNTEENQKIIDKSRNIPTEEAMPEKISVNRLGLAWRNFEGGVSLERLQMFFGEKVVPKKTEERYCVATARDDIEILIETDKSGNVVSADAWNEITMLNANKEKSKSGHLSGVIVDAVTGDGVNKASLTFVPAKKEIKQKQTKTNEAGVFSIELEPDIYTIVIKAEGYIEEEVLFEIEDGKTYNGEQFTISPELSKGAARIVLEWNAEPHDLDSYLSGQNDAGADVNVNFRNKQAKSGGTVFAELDLDDTSGYGPETTTIHDLNGVYRFQVADFQRTRTMKTYGATVKVYLPGKTPVTITIAPEAEVADIWVVCEIDHGELKVINKAPETEEFEESDK